MTEQEAIEALDAADSIEPDFLDREGIHVAADKILLDLVSPDVAHAYARLVERCGEFWYA